MRAPRAGSLESNRRRRREEDARSTVERPEDERGASLPGKTVGGKGQSGEAGRELIVVLSIFLRHQNDVYRSRLTISRVDSGQFQVQISAIVESSDADAQGCALRGKRRLSFFVRTRAINRTSDMARCLEIIVDGKIVRIIR